MSIQRQNKIHTWVVRTLMTMVLIVALCTFYFFMIQSSFGLNVSNSREAKKDLIVISCYPGANNPWKTDVIKSVADTIMRKKLELRNYVLTIPYNNTFLYKKGAYNQDDHDFCFVTKNNIRILHPKVLEGSLDFVNKVSREKFRMRNPEYITAQNDTTIKNKPKKFIDTTFIAIKCGAIIPRSVADEVFGKYMPAVGRTLRWCDRTNYHSEQVVCVYEDFPKYTGIANNIYLCTNDDILQVVEYDMFKYIFDLEDNSHLTLERIKHTIDKYLDELPSKSEYVEVGVSNPNNYDAKEDSIIKKNNEEISFFLLSPQRPAQFIVYHLYDENNMYDDFGWFNKNNSINFIMLAMIIVLMAVICLVNITMTTVPLEMKNLNIRMVIGTSKRYVWMCQTARYMFMAFVAFMLAMFIIGYVDSGRDLVQYMCTSMSIEDNKVMVWITLLVALSIGALCGLCAAWYSTSMPMDRVLKAKVGMDRKMRKIRNWMLRVQFFMALYPLCRLISDLEIERLMVSRYFNHGMINQFFAASSMFIIFVTLFCMIMQQNRYMYRSIAIRRVLGTTNAELIKMNIKHYVKLLSGSTIIFFVIVAVIILYIILHSIKFDGVVLMICLGMLRLILISTLLSFGIITAIIVVSVVFHSYFSNDKNLSNALKTE